MYVDPQLQAIEQINFLDQLILNSSYTVYWIVSHCSVSVFVKLSELS